MGFLACFRFENHIHPSNCRQMGTFSLSFLLVSAREFAGYLYSLHRVFSIHTIVPCDCTLWSFLEFFRFKGHAMLAVNEADEGSKG